MVCAIINKLFSLSILASLLMLTGCGTRDTRYFPPIQRDRTAHVAKQNLHVRAHHLDETECYDYFGFDVGQEGYKVIQLSISNDGPDEYTFRPSYLDLPRESGEQIAEFMHYDTYSRVFWWSLPALFLWWEAIPIFIIPYGIYWSNYNKKTTRYLREKSLEYDETVHIAPYETVQKFVFVQESAFKRTFQLSFFNETRRQLLTYDISVSPYNKNDD